MMTFSSYSIYLEGENGRCGIHLLNFRDAPESGTFHIDQEGTIKLGAVCVLNNDGQNERLVSESGTLAIDISTAATNHLMSGTFEMLLIGGITGDKVKLTGDFTAPLRQ